MSLLKKYPQLKIIQDIAKRKKVGVYLVGGFLRDYLLVRSQPSSVKKSATKKSDTSVSLSKQMIVEGALGRSCLDLDFAVEKDAIKFARLFANKIKGAFVLLDEEHGCARVARKKDGVIRTYDFADFRAPTLRKDLLSRDFTINTFSLHINALTPAMEINDGFMDLKKGMADLKAKRIRMASVKAFKDDPLRLLRAYSLRAMLGFKIEQKTQQQIRKDKDLIRNVSYERIREELFKILGSPRAAQNLKAMDRIGLLEKIIPQIAVMYNVRQGTYHHLDVWPHSLETVVQLEKIFADKNNDVDLSDYLNESLGGQHSRGAVMKLAALLHDIGKPDARRKEAGRTIFHTHERIGKAIARNVARLLKLSTRERHVLEDLVLWHLRPGYLSNFKKPSARAIFRYFRDSKEEAVSIALLALADQRSTCGPLTSETDQKYQEKICLSLVKQYFDKKKEVLFVRIINGDDLIKELRLKPSPLFGKILLEVEEKQSLGKIKTREEALDLARKMVGEG